MKSVIRSLAAGLLSFAFTLPVLAQGLVEYALILTMVCNNCDIGNGRLTNKITLETCATKIGSDAIKVGFIYKSAQLGRVYQVEELEIAFEGLEQGTTVCKYYAPPEGPGHLALILRGPPGLADDLNGDGIDDIGLWVPPRVAEKIGVAVQVSAVNQDGTRAVLPRDRVFLDYDYFNN